jgi:predicted ester cyclase
MTKPEDINEFAQDYASAWCSQEPYRVAAFFSETGSLSINGGPPSVGRTAIAEDAHGFMSAFPDMVVSFDTLVVTDLGTEFHWTLTGTNTGPGGTGNRVRISGYEEWKFASDGLIAESKGHFDQAEYDRQIMNGV